MFIPGANRQEALLAELTVAKVHFPNTQVQIRRVQDRMESLHAAMRKARLLHFHPSLDLSDDLHAVGNTTTCHRLGAT